MFCQHSDRIGRREQCQLLLYILRLDTGHISKAVSKDKRTVAMAIMILSGISLLSLRYPCPLTLIHTAFHGLGWRHCWLSLLHARNLTAYSCASATYTWIWHIDETRQAILTVSKLQVRANYLEYFHRPYKCNGLQGKAQCKEPLFYTYGMGLLPRYTFGPYCRCVLISHETKRSSLALQEQRHPIQMAEEKQHVANTIVDINWSDSDIITALFECVNILLHLPRSNLFLWWEWVYGQCKWCMKGKSIMIADWLAI